MQEIINGGVYQVDLKGSNDSEFNSNHPSLILKNLKEPEMFYIIPLTTYTKERWNKLKKYFCCRIESTNSIARIDKMQVRHKSYIPNRWFSNYKILYPTPEEINKVYDKLIDYISLAVDDCKKQYEKYFINYNDFKIKCDDFFEKFNFNNYSTFKLNFTVNALIATCDLNLAKELTFEDLKEIFKEYFDSKNLVVRFDRQSKKIIITVKLIDKKALTLKEKHDKIMVSKG
jgi:hypothetical protein